jgi:hypothetical protein
MVRKPIILLLLMFIINVESISAQEVVSVSPVQNALNVPKETNISVTFDVDMNSSTIDENSFIVHSFQKGLHSGTYSYDTETETAIFSPDKNFALGDMIYVILTEDIEDLTGNPLTSPYSWSFTVAVDKGIGEFEANVDYDVGYYPFSIYSSDLDGDGDMDLAVANVLSDSISVLLNNGDGTFAGKVDYEVGGKPWTVISSDLDSDGDMDLAVTNYDSNNVSILMNNGNGTFATDVTYDVGNEPFHVFSSDLDGDGDMDLAVANWLYDNVSILMNNGNGTFAAKVDYDTGNGPGPLFSSDLDSDGDMDLAVTNIGSDSVSILFNNGDGTFEGEIDYTTSEHPHPIFFSDLDSDGDMKRANEHPHSIFSSDLDSDGDMDLAMGNYYSDNVSILMNNGNGTFAAKVDYNTGNSPSSVFSSDLDSDGDMDLAVTNLGVDNVSILLNNGDGTFAEKVDYSTGDGPFSVFSSDLNSDGNMDLAIANRSSDNVSVLLNINASITITSPNGGEEWEVSSIHDIAWASIGTSGTVGLEYSINNGSDWVEIIASTPDIGTYPWTIPDNPSDSCLVRVCDTDKDPTDVSDAIFNIPTPELTVITPNGGENWKIDSTYNITWTSNGTSGAFKIEYSTDNGSNWIEIVDSTEDNGTYPWTIPDTQSDSCLARISDTDGSPSDTSDAIFTIPPVSGITNPKLPKVYSMSVNGVIMGNSIKLTYTIPEETSVRFIMYDITGKIVKEFSEEKKPGFYSREIDMNVKSTGVYFIRIEANGERFTKTDKVVIVK